MTDKCIFITGAGSGIGRATALRFARAGWFVGAFDLDAASAQTLADEIGGDKVLAGAIDVTDDASVADAMAAFEQAAGGRMHVLFNSAGVLKIGPFDEVGLDTHLWHFDVNVAGTMRVMLAALPQLRQTPGASVINMSSASADYGVPDFASYSSTKFAVRGLTEALNLEWAAYDIHVCDVMPPFVNTRMVTSAPDHVASIDSLGVKLTAEDVADVVWRAAGSRGATHWPVGAQFKLIWYSGQVLPAWLKRRVMKAVSKR